VSDPVKNGKATGERWAKLAARAVVDRSLTDMDVRVLAAFGIHADRDGICWPSQTTVADMVGIRRETVCKAVGRLRLRGYLDRYRKRTPRGWYRNVYRLLYPEYVPMPSRMPHKESDPAPTQDVAA
jgi:hypothetical protein